jgi:hypothetical protein
MEQSSTLTPLRMIDVRPMASLPMRLELVIPMNDDGSDRMS